MSVFLISKHRPRIIIFAHNLSNEKSFNARCIKSDKNINSDLEFTLSLLVSKLDLMNLNETTSQEHHI